MKENVRKKRTGKKNVLVTFMLIPVTAKKRIIKFPPK